MGSAAERPVPDPRAAGLRRLHPARGAITITALWQSILATLYRLRADNQTWRRYRRTLVEENKWLAQRHGISAKLDYGVLTQKPFGSWSKS